MKSTAYAFMIVATVSLSWLILPLAWLIPMTLRAKAKIEGEHPTIALGVCAIIFGGIFGIVAGILLIISNNKDCG